MVENKSLSQFLADLEEVQNRVDFEAETSGDFPEALISELLEKNQELKDKVDQWVEYLDALKGEELVLETRRARAEIRLKKNQAFQKALKNYAKNLLLSRKITVLQGSESKICLQKSPPSLDVGFERHDKTFYKSIDESFASFEPSLSPYLKQVSCFVVDTDRVKQDIEAGKNLPWAKLKQDFHVRIR